MVGTGYRVDTVESPRIAPLRKFVTASIETYNLAFLFKTTHEVLVYIGKHFNIEVPSVSELDWFKFILSNKVQKYMAQKFPEVIRFYDPFYTGGHILLSYIQEFLVLCVIEMFGKNYLDYIHFSFLEKDLEQSECGILLEKEERGPVKYQFIYCDEDTGYFVKRHPVFETPHKPTQFVAYPSELDLNKDHFFVVALLKDPEEVLQQKTP